MSDYLVIDSISSDKARCEALDGSSVIILLSDLPYGAKAGDWLVLELWGYRVDHEKTKSQKDKNISLFNRLKKK